MLADCYLQSCESRGIAPRQEVVGMENGSLHLPGSTFERFSNRINDADVEAIVQAASMTGGTFVDIILPYNDITSIGGKCLAMSINFSSCFDSVTVLDLSYNHLGGDAGVALSQSLKNNHTLTQLRLPGNPLGAEGAGQAFGYALADALCANSTLSSLDLYSTDLDMKALVPIVGSLANNHGLVRLNIGKPLLPSPDDVRYVVHHLALSLADNTQLQELELSFFGLCDEHLQHLFPALCTSAIVSLNLNANKLSQDAGKLLGRLLDRKGDFCSVVASNNRIGDAGVAPVAQSLRVHPHLQVLALQNAEIGREGIACLAEAIAKCRALRSVSLWGNKLQGGAAAELYEIEGRLDTLDHVDFGFQVVDGVPAVYKK